MPSYYYTKFQKNPCVGRIERCPLVVYDANFISHTLEYLVLYLIRTLEHLKINESLPIENYS